MIVERGMKWNCRAEMLNEGMKMEKRKRRWKRRMNKTDKLEREEKQPEGIKLSPFLLILIEWNEKGEEED